MSVLLPANFARLERRPFVEDPSEYFYGYGVWILEDDHQ